MMRNVIRVLLVSSALVAVTAPSANAAVSTTTLSLVNTPAGTTAVTETYGTLLGALPAGDSVGSATAVSGLQSSIGGTSDFGAVSTSMLVDLVREACEIGTPLQNLASVIGGAAGALPEGTLDADAISAAGASCYPAGSNFGIGAVGPAAGAPAAAAPGGLSIIGNGAPGGNGGATVGAGTPVSPT